MDERTKKLVEAVIKAGDDMREELTNFWGGSKGECEWLKLVPQLKDAFKSQPDFTNQEINNFVDVVNQAVGKKILHKKPDVKARAEGFVNVYAERINGFYPTVEEADKKAYAERIRVAFVREVLPGES